MNTANTAHFDQIREQNRRIIRNLLRDKPGIGKSELASLTGLTFPTVSSAVKDLVGSGEVTELESISVGGRPGAVFQLNEKYQYILCAYINELKLFIRIYDACKNKCEEFETAITPTINPQQLIAIFKEVKERYASLSIISLGIPGVVLGGVIKHLPYLPDLEDVDFKTCLQEELDITAFIENDINAIVLAEQHNYKDMAHIILNSGCIGAGIMLNGQLIRGAHGCAGELEFICDEKTDCIEALTQAILAVTCVVDIADISVSGLGIDDAMLDKLKENIGMHIPQNRIPNIHFVPDLNKLYYQGLLNIAMEFCENL